MSQEGNAAQHAIICNPIQNGAAAAAEATARFPVPVGLPFYSRRPTSGDQIGQNSVGMQRPILSCLTSIQVRAGGE